MYNAGQSCCAVEVNGTSLSIRKSEFDRAKQRIYVHECVYDNFVSEYVNEVQVSHDPIMEYLA